MLILYIYKVLVYYLLLYDRWVDCNHEKDDDDDCIRDKVEYDGDSAVQRVYNYDIILLFEKKIIK